jgi:hypothetical protein
LQHSFQTKFAQVPDDNQLIRHILNVRSINIAERALDFNRRMRS